MESLANAKGKKGKPPPRHAHLEESIVRHKAHITRLEQMLRLLDNEVSFSSKLELCPVLAM
jgi:CCR4-NOT transcriptional regulation complex NOT5 subunit